MQICRVLQLLTSLHFIGLSRPLVSSSTANGSGSPGRVALKGLDAAQFRHPLDRDLTNLIQTLPGGKLAEGTLRQAFPVIEQGIRLDLLSSSVRVSSQQLPHLHDLLQEACQVLDFGLDQPLPELYIQSSPQPNAYTLALRGEDTAPIVVVTSALLDQSTDPELQAILGHELGHLKCEHSLYFTLGGLASTPLRNLPFVGGQIDSTLQQWRLAAEYTCDRASLLVAQDPHVVASAMLKLTAGTGKYNNMSAEAFVAQCLEYDDLLQKANPLVRASIRRQLSQRTHPLPVRRVAELEKWSKSKEYANILKRGQKLD